VAALVVAEGGTMVSSGTAGAVTTGASVMAPGGDCIRIRLLPDIARRTSDVSRDRTRFFNMVTSETVHGCSGSW